MSKFVTTSQFHVPLLDMNPEGKLQREIKDIIDELDMMMAVHKKQRDIIKRFCKHVEHILDPDGKLKDGLASGSGNGNNGGGSFSPRDTFPPPQRQPSFDLEQESTDQRSLRESQFYWFRTQAQELLCDIGDRIDELEGLRKGAESTAQSVNDLLSLKQQQASIVQAWESVRRADESVSQGRAIMIFTIVTIIFVSTNNPGVEF